MGLYLPEGYLNWDYIISKGMTWNIIIGGRGTGKTYGLLKKALVDKVFTMFMRHTQTQIDLVASPEFSPLKPINQDMGWTSPFYDYVTGAKNVYNLYPMEINEKGKAVPCGPPLGHATALSTIKNLRGFSGQEIKWLILDEFIPEEHEREIKNVGNALFNAYETINRNRELKGEDPLKVFLLANSNNLASEMLITMNLLKIITRMEEKHFTEHLDKKRSLGLWKLDDSPISEQKRDTALYRLAGEQYSAMALDNQFSHKYASDVMSRNLSEYKPISAIGELTIYRHKSKDMLYVTTHRSGSPRIYDTTDFGIKAFRRDHIWLQTLEMKHQIEYETELCHILFTKLAWK